MGNISSLSWHQCLELLSKQQFSSVCICCSNNWDLVCIYYPSLVTNLNSHVDPRMCCSAFCRFKDYLPSICSIILCWQLSSHLERKTILDVDCGLNPASLLAVSSSSLSSVDWVRPELTLFAALAALWGWVLMGWVTLSHLDLVHSWR